MFYSQLIKLCKERNIKPTPLVKSLGLSPGNLKRWENGASVNSDILSILADYFEVSVDFLLDRTDYASPVNEIIKNLNEYESLDIFKDIQNELKVLQELTKKAFSKLNRH